MKITIEKDAYMPTAAPCVEGALELRSPIRTIIRMNQWATIDTGIRMEIPSGHIGLLTSSDNLEKEHGITCLKTIGSGNKDTIKIVLFNHSRRDYKIIERGQTIAQLVILPITKPKLEITSNQGEST